MSSIISMFNRTIETSAGYYYYLHDCSTSKRTLHSQNWAASCLQAIGNAIGNKSCTYVLRICSTVPRTIYLRVGPCPVGALVGAEVGSAVGALVGAAVGPRHVGALIGAEAGSAVGALVGTAVGPPVVLGWL